MPRVIITRRITVTRVHPQPYYTLARQRRGPRIWLHTLLARLIALGAFLLIAVPVYLHISPH
jgi:hypothetical protein